jgi:hypothetical protein
MYGMTPVYFSYLCSILLLLNKLDKNYDHDIPWIIIFVPLWLSDGFCYISKIANIIEALYELQNNDITQTRIKALCSLLDLIGANITKVLLFFYLIHIGPTKLLFVFAPLWGTTCIAILFRLSLIPRRNFRRAQRNMFTIIANCFVQITLRVIQTLLIALKIDGYIHVNWAIVALPSWIVICFSLVCACILLHCSSFVHMHAIPILRFQAIRLMLLCALQLFVISLCTLLFSVWYVSPFILYCIIYYHVLSYAQCYICICICIY